MIALKNILVATDFSESAGVALSYGRDLARTFNARLHLVHLVEDVMMRYSPEVGFAVPELQKNLEASAQRDLAALITDDDRRTLYILTSPSTNREDCQQKRAARIESVRVDVPGAGFP